MVRFGFPCITSGLGWSTNHKTILRNGYPDLLEKKTRENFNHLEKILSWMRDTHPSLRVFRIGSSFVPFASHNEVLDRGWDWKRVVYEEAIRLRPLIKENRFRLSFHPGQYTVLNSPHTHVVQNALREIEYNAIVLDLLQPGDSSGKIVIHLGGVYGDKEESIKRLVNNIGLLSNNAKYRLVLENDDKTYTVQDAIYASSLAGVLPLLDIHHHWCNPSPNFNLSLENILSVWEDKDQVPKIHVSSPRPGSKKTAHSDWIDQDTRSRLEEVIRNFKNVDIIVEAKKKEQSALDLINKL